ncbi:hypothetical protein HanRHA438_Chr03g0142611 [Helianthus annuus]|nr:hypothetical protein HanRHA438_Chr03g0142611 [Helianthus annuus]
MISNVTDFVPNFRNYCCSNPNLIQIICIYKSFYRFLLHQQYSYSINFSERKIMASNTLVDCGDGY